MHGVLLVEDDEAFGRAIGRILAAREFEVFWVKSSAELRSFLAAGQRPRVRYALVDDRLADGFGLDLLPLLDSLDPQPATALFSGFTLEDRALAAFRADRVLLPKPRTPSGVLDLLSALEERSREPRGLLTDASAGDSEAPHAFGAFSLHSDGIHTPTGFMALRTASIELLRFLLAKNDFTSASDVARGLLGRRDRAAPEAVRRRVANTRRALATYDWLIETVLKQGYRIDPRARQSCVRDPD